MDIKTLVSILTGTVLVTSVATISAVKILEEVPIDVISGLATIEEHIPPVQPIIYIDEKCPGDSLLLRIGTAELCTGKLVYTELKQVIIDDLLVEEIQFLDENNNECTEGEEGCVRISADISIENAGLFYAILAKEMIKNGQIKALSEDRETAKAEALALLRGDNKELEFIN